jgi:hypothetical protein
MQQINNFIRQLQRRLNQRMALRELLNAAIVFFSGALVVALIYVLRGYKVDWRWYFLPLAVSVIFFLLRYVGKYCNRQRAANFADHHFDLKNALVSELDFARKKGPFHKLRRDQTEKLCVRDKLKKIKFQVSRKTLLTAAGLLLLTLLLSMLDDSAAVRNARDAENRMQETTENLNKELKKKFEEMVKKLTPQEKKMLKKSGLPEEIKKLESKKELKEALRQYGKLERKIRSLAARMDLTEKERLLRMMARKLMKSKDTRNFGEKLNEKKYREAAKELKSNKLKDPELKSKSEKQKKLRLQRIMEKMLESASEAGKSKSSLSKKIEKLMESLGKCSNKQKCDNLDEINGDIDELGKELENIEDAEKFLEKLKKMCKACNKCQAGCKACKAACMGGQGKGTGKGIGSGGAGNFNNKAKDPDDKGYAAGLKGQKNKGSSRMKIEEAETGHGVKTRSERKVKVYDKRQVEAFISRDDVPPAMKSGVKEYFTKIHTDNEEQK